MQPSSTKKERKSKIPYILIAGGALVLAIAAGLLFRTPASATSSFLSLAETQYTFIVGSRIDTCNLCHVPNAIPSLNAYGTDFLNRGLNAAALVAIENLDSDGDGVTNIQELHAFTFPGDPNDKPVASTATPTTAPSSTPTTAPTTAPTGVITNTPTPLPTISVTTETPIPTATITPIPSGTVGPAPAAQCLEDDERNEHFKKSHGKSEEKIAAAEEANEERLCEEHGEGNEIEEAHESEQAQMHEQEDGENEMNESNESDQVEMGNQENQGQEQEDMSNDQSFINSIDLWLSQWFRTTAFRG